MIYQNTFSGSTAVTNYGSYRNCEKVKLLSSRVTICRNGQAIFGYFVYDAFLSNAGDVFYFFMLFLG